MTATSGSAAQAAIGGATRELRLPSVGGQAAWLVEITARNGTTTWAYLAAELDDRSARRAAAPPTPASYASSRWPTSTPTRSPPSLQASSPAWHPAPKMDAGEPVVLLGTVAPARPSCSSAWVRPPAGKAAGSAA